MLLAASAPKIKRQVGKVGKKELNSRDARFFTPPALLSTENRF